MLPQYGGVPNYKIRISGPALLMLVLVLVTGGMLALSFHLYSDGGDYEVRNRITLTLLVTGVAAVFVLLVATNRFWHLHLWADVRDRKRRKHHGKRHGQHSHRT